MNGSVGYIIVLVGLIAVIWFRRTGKWGQIQTALTSSGITGTALPTVPTGSIPPGGTAPTDAWGNPNNPLGNAGIGK